MDMEKESYYYFNIEATVFEHKTMKYFGCPKKSCKGA
jgi:hypothetical protein